MLSFLHQILRHDKPRTRKSAHVSGTVEFLETSRMVTLFIFVATIAAIVLISFVGVSTVNLPVLPNQLANVRIVASAPFSYKSAEKTKIAKEQMRDRVPPVYRLDFEPLQQFETHLRELLADLENFQRNHPANAVFAGKRKEDFSAMVDTFNAKGPYHLSGDDVLLLLNAGDASARTALIDTGLRILHEIYTEGVHDDHAFNASNDPSRVSVFQIARQENDIVQRSAQSMEQALTSLRINLTSEAANRNLSVLLFHIFRNGLIPNLIFNRDATLHLQDDTLRDLKPDRKSTRLNSSH